MSFVNFPAALPFFESLHKKELLEKLISELGNERQVLGDIAALRIKDGEQEEQPRHPFMDAFEKEANLTLTNNGALTHASTTDACLDLFYGIDSVQPDGREALLNASWKQDPSLTLHIIFYARSIHRGKSLKESFFGAYCWLLQNHPQTAITNLHVLIDGTVRSEAELQKSIRDKKNGQQAKSEGWEMVSEEKYELLTRRDFLTHGYWKDLGTLLTIYCQGELKENCSTYKALQWPRVTRDKKVRRIARRERTIRYNLRLAMNEEDRKKNVEENHVKHMESNGVKKEEARALRLKTRVERNKIVSDLLENDKTYRALHFTVATLFANQLKTDLAQLEKNKADIEANRLNNGPHALGFNLSLAAKWAPSLGFSFDKNTFLATSIGELLFPPCSHQDKDEPRVHYLNKVRELYRKEYLAPLRKALNITEHFMAPGKWDTVDIRHMPSVCLQKNMGSFFKHAPETVLNYMAEVSAGTKKVSGATIAPNELVYRVIYGNIPKSVASFIRKAPELSLKYTTAQTELVNGQWNTLIESIRNTSALASNKDKDGNEKKSIDLGECMAICDVSGSMMCGANFNEPEKQPLNAAIGLSLVVSNLAKPPFNGAIITFTSEPSLFKVKTDLTFTEQVNTIMEGPVGYNTDICKVFTDVLLPMAKKHKLAPEDMVKRLFIFTDMEFDGAPNGMDEYLTTQEFIRKQYEDAGYKVPELVWWNLCSAAAYRSHNRMNTPVTKDDTGVSLLSGFSASMIKTFLDGDVGDSDDIEEENDNESNKATSTPVDFMKKAVCHESFNGLIVVD
ncbi:unnamed protein product [Mucor hiemalis]